KDERSCNWLHLAACGHGAGGLCAVSSGVRLGRFTLCNLHATRHWPVADLQHLLDRGNPGDGIFGELPDAVADCAHQAPIDVDGAAAHTCDDAGVLRLFALQAREDHVLAGTNGVIQHAEDFDVHRLGLDALKDGIGNGVKTAMDFGQREELRRLHAVAYTVFEGVKPEQMDVEIL